LAKLSNNNPKFFLCCENGKLLLLSLRPTLQELEVLLTNKEISVVKFRDQICMYNSVLAFISLGAKVNESVTRGIIPYSFRIQGELYHKIVSVCVVEGPCPQFAQLYIHDTKSERQSCHAIMPSLDPMMLDQFVDHDVQYQSLCPSVQNGKGYDGNRRCSHGFEIASHYFLNKGFLLIQCAEGI
jgi:hypothetical protein